MNDPATTILLEDVRFSYARSSFTLDVKRIEIRARERVACIGPSGCGKTTLVHMMAGVLVPNRGRVFSAGLQLDQMSDAKRRAHRLSRIGMVFQEFELLDYLTTLENILLPYHLGGLGRIEQESLDRAHELACAMKIEHALRRRPSRLSHGERQRVSLCRALVTRPPLVIADEPTGNLDPKTAGTILDLLFAQVMARHATLIMVTHDHGQLHRFDRVIDMKSHVMDSSA